MTKIKAVILNYNTAADCEKCIGYLKMQDYNGLSIVVVDNDSPDRHETEKLSSYCQSNGIDFIEAGENRGFSAGNNIGLRYASKNGMEWGLVINPDIELQDTQYISGMIKRIQDYPKTVVAASNVVMPEWGRQNPMRELGYWEETLWGWEIIKRAVGIRRLSLDKDETGYCSKVAGCCFFVKMSFLQEIGYLDENVFMYSEEPILAKQVEKAGYKELYVKELTAYHQHIEKRKGSSPKRMEQLMKSRCYYLEKYSGYKGMGLKLIMASKHLQAAIWKAKNAVGGQ